MTTEEDQDGRERFIYWWPVVARVAGVAGAFVQAGYAAVTHQAADAGFLAFCGALIAAPAIFDQQEKRNSRRKATAGEKGHNGHEDR